MKHAREDYDRIQDPLGLIPEDEPVFLLRGQDTLAPDIIYEWAKRLRQKDKFNNDNEFMAWLAEKQARAMIKWQMKIKGKLPDLPKETITS